MKSKKGQLKIQEMAFVLLAIVFLFALVLLFFTAFQSNVWKKNAAEIREIRGITLLEVIASMPELRCSSSSSESVCIDEDKLAFFNKSSEFKGKYAILWSASMLTRLEIQEIYPEDKKYVLYEKKFDGSTQAFTTYVPLCIQDYNSKCSIAKIKVYMNMP